MQDKEKDIKYCGVDAEKIKNAKPILDSQSLEWFVHWIRERYMAHIRKDQGCPQPWTNDKIIANYRFTNVRREQDRQTRYLIANIVENTNLSYKEKILNCILFRCWNLWETMRDFGGPWKFEDITSGAALKKAQEVYDQIVAEHPRHGFFTSVFLVSGLKGATRRKFGTQNAVTNILVLAEHIVQENYIERCIKAESPIEFTTILQELPGIAGFLSYQMFVDCTYIPEFPFSENEYTVAGPGCRRGIKALFKDPAGLSPEECIFWLRDNLAKVAPQLNCKELMVDLPEEERFLSVMSLENCFCEFSKYYKSCIGKGRPKKHYVPYTGEENE